MAADSQLPARPQLTSHTHEIPGGLRIGDSVNIRGKVVGRRFSVFLCEGIPATDRSNKLFSFSLHPDGSWIVAAIDCSEGPHRMRERRGVTTLHSMARGDDFHFHLHIDATRITLELNQRTVTWIPLTFTVDGISFIVIEGEDRFKSLDFDDVWSMATKHNRSVSFASPPPRSPNVGAIPDSSIPVIVAPVVAPDPTLASSQVMYPSDVTRHPTKGRLMRKEDPLVQLTLSRPRPEILADSHGERVQSYTAPNSPGFHRRVPLVVSGFGPHLRPPQAQRGQVLRSNSDVRAQRQWDKGGEGSVNRMITNYLALQSQQAQPGSERREESIKLSSKNSFNDVGTIPRIRPKSGTVHLAVETPSWRSNQVLAEEGTRGLFQRKTSQPYVD